MSSTEQYARRFAGPIGDYFLETQTKVLVDSLASSQGTTVLDVGGGHAQLALPLARRGFDVTVLGSDASCRQRLDRVMAGVPFRFAIGDLQALPFDRQQFDIVVGFRMLAHVRQPNQFLAGLCRVSRQLVVVDYPDWRSANWFAGPLYRLKLLVERDTRRYRCFSATEIAGWFRDNDFSVIRRRGQFVLPMAVHRAVNWPRMTRLVEESARGMGVTDSWGSPVIVAAERSASP